MKRTIFSTYLDKWWMPLIFSVIMFVLPFFFFNRWLILLGVVNLLVSMIAQFRKKRILCGCFTFLIPFFLFVILMIIGLYNIISNPSGLPYQPESIKEVVQYDYDNDGINKTEYDKAMAYIKKAEDGKWVNQIPYLYGGLHVVPLEGYGGAGPRDRQWENNMKPFTQANYVYNSIITKDSIQIVAEQRMLKEMAVKKVAIKRIYGNIPNRFANPEEYGKAISTIHLIKRAVEIKINKKGNVYEIPCKINGLALNLIFDTDASDVSISSVEAQFMLKNKYLESQDILGNQQYRIANGKIEEGTKIKLRQVEIGELTLHNINASVVHNQQAPLLLGQSALSKFGQVEIDNVEIDNNKGVLRVKYLKKKKRIIDKIFEWATHGIGQADSKTE